MEIDKVKELALSIAEGPAAGPLAEH